MNQQAIHPSEQLPQYPQQPQQLSPSQNNPRPIPRLETDTALFQRTQ
jgi:hypothetical protein